MTRRNGNAHSLLWIVSLVAAGVGAWRLYLVHPRWTVVVIVLLAAGAVTWAMWATHALRARRQAAARVEHTDELSGPEFEQWCADLLRAKGFHDVHVCGQTNDRGVDITAHDPEGLFTVVQCKRQGAAVGSPVMREFVGTAVVADAERALFMTNSRFTAEAALVAEEQEIELVDRDVLAEWLAPGGGA